MPTRLTFRLALLFGAFFLYGTLSFILRNFLVAELIPKALRRGNVLALRWVPEAEGAGKRLLPAHWHLRDEAARPLVLGTGNSQYGAPLRFAPNTQPCRQSRP